MLTTQEYTLPAHCLHITYGEKYLHQYERNRLTIHLNFQTKLRVIKIICQGNGSLSSIVLGTGCLSISLANHPLEAISSTTCLSAGAALGWAESGSLSTVSFPLCRSNTNRSLPVLLSPPLAITLSRLATTSDFTIFVLPSSPFVSSSFLITK